jgi:hypothetical protein
MAPMSLLTYQDVRPWTRAIKQRVVNREMPPPADLPKPREFDDSDRWHIFLFRVNVPRGWGRTAVTAKVMDGWYSGGTEAAAASEPVDVVDGQARTGQRRIRS